MSEPIVSKPRVKQPHVQPRSYLQYFCNPSGKLHVYEKGHKCFPLAPKKACRENGYFTIIKPDRSRDEQLETWLETSETRASMVRSCLMIGQTLNRDLVRSLNQAQVWSAQRAVFASFHGHDLLEYVDRNINSLRYGVNAYRASAQSLAYLESSLQTWATERIRP